MLPKYFDIAESELSSKPYSAGAMYYCYDTGNLYLDSITSAERVKVSTDTIILSKETDRTSMLAPVPGKIYCVLSSGCMYIYNGDWIRLGKSSFEIPDVSIETAGTGTNAGYMTATVSNVDIHADNKASFIPDPSVADLASDITATCAEGYVSIRVKSSYPIFGRVIID